MPPIPRLFVSIYTDEDITSQLAPALRRRGYMAASAAEANNLAISDEEQLRYASQQKMAILTANARDFIPLARNWAFAGREHAGIVVVEQLSRNEFGELLRRVLTLLDSVTADELHNQVVFLQRFRR